MTSMSRGKKEKASLHCFSRLIEFLGLDHDHWVFQRHERLHLLNILAMQQRLVKLEERFDRASDVYGPHVVDVLPSVEKEEDLLQEIQDAIKAYGSSFDMRTRHVLGLIMPR